MNDTHKLNKGVTDRVDKSGMRWYLSYKSKISTILQIWSHGKKISKEMNLKKFHFQFLHVKTILIITKNILKYKKITIY
jgi:hypothetical protein